MRHFDSHDEYADALEARLDEVIDEIEDHGALSDVASRTVVTFYGDTDLLAISTVDPELRWGWCPMGIIEHSETNLENAVPDDVRMSEDRVDVSQAAYYILEHDLTRAYLDREAGQ